MKPKHLIIVSSLIIAGIVALALWFVSAERSAMQSELEEATRLQREIMQEELLSLSEEYEQQYNKVNINGGEASFVLANDSLLSQLRGERAKVDRLLEELSQVKKTSSARIAELTREVGTLRRVLKTYVAQIDSLHTANEALRAENREVKANFDRATSEVRQLASERQELTDRVNLAAKLDATAISAVPIDKRGKSTKRIDRIENIQISFRVAKNITATPGVKMFYTRIMTPTDELMAKAGAGSFTFEGKQLVYSTRREIEYSGEETPVVMYWPVEESLTSGTYRIMIFADGNLIGTTTMTL